MISNEAILAGWLPGFNCHGLQAVDKADGLQGFSQKQKNKAPKFMA